VPSAEAISALASQQAIRRAAPSEQNLYNSLHRMVFMTGDAMRIVSYTEARNSLKSLLDAVADDHDIAVISRRDGSDAVVMSRAHYQSVMETIYLLSSPANASHLNKSIAQDKAAKAKRRKLVVAE
jgi:antitoxin YefM